MSTEQLPEEEPGSIQWEGGDEHKGDEEETRDPHTAPVVENNADKEDDDDY